jgi:hypothetical protein
VCACDGRAAERGGVAGNARNPCCGGGGAPYSTHTRTHRTTRSRKNTLPRVTSGGGGEWPYRSPSGRYSRDVYTSKAGASVIIILLYFYVHRIYIYAYIYRAYGHAVRVHHMTSHRPIIARLCVCVCVCVYNFRPAAHGLLCDTRARYPRRPFDIYIYIRHGGVGVLSSRRRRSSLYYYDIPMRLTTPC